jgi:hypothetical protein
MWMNHYLSLSALQGALLLSYLATVGFLLTTMVDAFAPASSTKPFSTVHTTPLQEHRLFSPHLRFPTFKISDGRRPMTDTSLRVMLDVPPNFFATSFVVMGLVLDVSKSFGRLRMEERAWEQRLEEARLRRLEDDPTLTELELRRKEAALEWSAYGKPRQDELGLERQMREEQEARNDGIRRRRGVKVMERDDDGDDELVHRGHRMSDDDINSFEVEYGVEYDPYYDDPYSEDELPDNVSYKVDKRYGDRIYSDGEIFYKDKESGLFYRQGAKPRSLSFW